MSSLVQHSNTPHYPQSTMMNSGEASAARQQRPTHNPSKNLHSQELQCLYDILGNNRVTLATAVAQILNANNGAWVKKACGVFCFVKDYDSRSYCFRLYDLKSRKSIYEETVHAGLRLDKGLDVFYTFDGAHCKVGINFVDRDEAQAFFHQFQSKQDDRQKKKKTNASGKGPAPAGGPAYTPTQSASSYNASSSTMNGGRPSIVPNPTITSLPVQTPNSTPKSKQSSSKNSGFFTLRGKKKSDRPDISAPIQSTLVHVSHIGTKESFFNDDAQKEMFEKVLSNMHISPEDKLYVREVIQNGGIEKLLAKADPLQHPSNQRPAPAPPEVPQRDYPTVGKTNGNRPPFQDVSAPSAAYHQSNNQQRANPLQGLFTPPTTTSAPAPAIPPRPGPRVPENPPPPMQAPPPPPPPPPPPYSGSTMPHFEASRGQGPAAPPPPPPPLPNDFWNSPAPTHPAGNGGPPPPPPPPPPPLNSPGFPSGLPNAAISNSSSNSARDDLLQAIRDGAATSRLKPASPRPPLPQQQPTSSGESSPGAQDTMASNIMKILAERRKKLIGTEDDKESDSSEDEWSN